MAKKKKGKIKKPRKKEIKKKLAKKKSVKKSLHKPRVGPRLKLRLKPRLKSRIKKPILKKRRVHRIRIVKKIQPVQKLKVAPQEIEKTRIKVIGIGGGGGSIISEIAEKLKRADFVVANTDSRALQILGKKAKKFQFGENITHGLGTGMNPELGKAAAETDKEKIKSLLKDQSLCIIVASLGGGTGSGATPIFAKISREMGNITYGIFTLPFKFEGEKKEQIARESLEKLKPYLNAVSILPNERIFQLIDKQTPLKEALSEINKNLSESLAGLIETIYSPGLINIDFADLRAILEGRGRLAYLNTVEFEGPSQIEQAVQKVVASPLYPYTIKGAKGILFNIVGEKELSLASVNQISKNIWQLVNPEAKIIFGVSHNQKQKDRIKVTLLATGCGGRFFSSSLGQRAKELIQKPKRIVRQVVLPSEKEKPLTVENKSFRKKTQTKKPEKEKKTDKNQKPKARKEKTQNLPQNQAEKIIPSVTESKNENISNVKPSLEKIEVKVRRNGLQLKKAMEEAEKDILRQEEEWETPAFLRRKIGEDK